MEIPDAVKWLLPIVVGQSWPEGDETKLRALAEAWHTASGAIAPAQEAGAKASDTILQNWTGQGADAYREQWKKFVEGDEAYFKQLADASKALGDSCDQTALDVEYTKYMIIISLIVLAAQIAAMIAAAAATFGGSTAGIAPAQMATRMTVQMLFRQLLEKLAQQGFKQLAKELLEKFLKQGLKKIGMEVLKNEAINLGMDAGVQGLQMLKGDRKSWDWSKTQESAVSGAVAGVVGAASGSIGKGATESLSHSAAGQIADSAMRAGARGAVEGVAQTVGQAAVTGKLGELTPEQLLMGASGGAVGGAVGGAKESIHAIGEANRPHVDTSSPEGAHTESASSAPERPESAPPAEQRNSETAQGPERETVAPRHAAEEQTPEQQSGETRAAEPQRAPETPAVETPRQAEAPQMTETPHAAEAQRTIEAPHTAEAPQTAEAQHTASAPAEAPQASEAPRHAPDTSTAPSTDHAPVAERAPMAERAPAAEPVAQAERVTQQPSEPPTGQQSTPAQPSGGMPPMGGTPSGGGHSGGSSGGSSHGGYGMSNPGGGSQGFVPGSGGTPEFGRQTGARQQDTVGAQGFTGAQDRPVPMDGPVPNQPPQPPPPPTPGGMPPGGMPPGGQHGPGGPRPGGPPGPMPNQFPPRPQHPNDPRFGPPDRRQPPPGGPYQADPRRMPPPPDPRRGPMPPPPGPPRPPMPGGRGPAGYPQVPPRGPHPGGRPPMPPPPHGRPPMPLHDPRFGPPRPTGPPRPGGPVHPGGPVPPQHPRGPMDRVPPQQQRPMPPHEPPRPIERAPEPPRPQEALPQQHIPEQPRPPEHVPEEVPAPVEDRTPEPAQEQHEPAPHQEGHVDERYLTDANFHTDDPAGVHRIQDTLIDSGKHDLSSGELRHEQVRREALALRDQFHPNMSDAGAFAVHAYTRFELSGPLNEAHRFGGPALADLAPQGMALVSGMNEMPPHSGPVSRRIDFHGDMAKMDAFMAHYQEGAHVVEPSFLSSSKIDAENPRSRFPGEVEMRIESKTGRDVESMASLGHEKEVLFKPGTQLEVKSVEMGRGHPDHPEFAKNEPRWIVHAEEVVVGDPRHLGETEAKHAVDERRDRERADQARFDRERDAEVAKFYEDNPQLKSRISELLGGGTEYREPATHKPDGGWSELAKPLTEDGEPVLHAGSAETPAQNARLMRDTVPELENVNTRNYFAPDAYERGFRANAAESLVAFEQRMHGEDAHAAPGDERRTHQQNLDQVRARLGGNWSGRESFADVARELGDKPVGSRVAVAYERPNPFGGGESRMVAAIKTEDGIVFADPRSGRLAELPEHPGPIKTLPLGDEVQFAHHETPVREGDSGIGDRLDVDDRAPVVDEGHLFDPDQHASQADHQSIRDAVGNDEVYQGLRDDALAKRDAAENLRHVTDEGAIAVHGYTTSHYAYDLNEASRSGSGHAGFELAQHNTRAVMDGLAQIPRESGECVRGIDAHGNPRLAELIAGPYKPGEVVVETAFSSASIKTGELTTTKFGDDVQLHIRSDNIRDISQLSQNPAERETLSPPGTQLLIHDRTLVEGPNGKRTWVIHAEEIGPGHPRYLDPETAQRQMAERREEHVRNAPEFKAARDTSIADALGTTLTPPEHPAPHAGQLSDVLDGRTAEPVEPAVPEHGWSSLAQATNPPSEAAIHADTGSPGQHAAYVRERYPELAEVNPHYNDRDALENGYRSNCTRGPEAYWDRLHGGHATAEPIRLEELDSRGTLEHIEGKFGREFSDRADYDSVIREMREMPLDHHAVVAVKWHDANGIEQGHVAMVVHTREGVAFIDPQSGSLMHLPHPPTELRLMHVGVPGEHVPFAGQVAPEHIVHGGYGSSPEVEHFLARDDVAAALHDNPNADFIREHLPHHPDLVRVMAEPGNEYLTRSLLDNPKTIASLLKHPEAIPILEDAVREVNERGYSVIDDVERDGVAPYDPTPEQAEIADHITEIVDDLELDDQRHASFDRSRIGEPGYAESWVAEERANWSGNQGGLNRVVERIAAETGGEPGFRLEPKDDARALAKIRGYGGDGSQLTDLVGAKIQFARVADLYRALDALSHDPDLEIVSFEDRLRNPVPSGYRDLQLNVRLPNGHVAELRLHLTHIDDVAAYEHALYEVRRDFKTLSRKEGRLLSPEEAALDAALTEQVRERFGTALRKGLPPEPTEENT